MATAVMIRDVTLSRGEQSPAEESAILVPMDEETFRAFYDRTARSLWAYLSRITGDRQLADDLLQESYFRFFRSKVAHESESHRRNSLFRIATNLAHDAGRRRKRRGQDVPLLEEIDSTPPGDRGTADRVERRTDLARAMAHLKPQQREMLWLAYALGSSHEEIAAMTGVTAGSVRSLLLRARRKLADLLRGGLAAAGGRSIDG